MEKPDALLEAYVDACLRRWLEALDEGAAEVRGLDSQGGRQ